MDSVLRRISAQKSIAVGFKVLLAAISVLASAACAAAETAGAPLAEERRIALPNVAGRIDHLAIDHVRRRLAVAELGNNAVDIVDLDSGAVVRRLSGLQAPQGLAFDLAGAILVVAERGGGAVQLFDAETFEPLAAIPLGEDADNVRIDPRDGHAVVGYGDGAFAVIDLDAREVLARIEAPAHPEGFQIEPQTGRLFVNLPDNRTIGVVDLDARRLETTWKLPSYMLNFPLALDPEAPRLAVVFRLPARLVLFDRNTGAVIASRATCGDSDDLFFDAPRRRIYVACGGGSVDVFDATEGALRRIARTPTSSGARTALFVPAMDRLFVAARARNGRDAAIIVLRPAP